MPDPLTLKIGDRVRLLRVPAADLRQRERERREGLPDAGWTADTIERIIEQQPVVTISRIDEYGQPCFNCTVTGADGRVEEHTLTTEIDDGSWERA
jgi:hypothetical protein